VQLEVLSRLMERRFGGSVAFGPGRIVYLETIAAPAEGVGHFEPLRHYAEVHLLLEPLPRGTGPRKRGQSRPYSTVQYRTLQDRTLPYRDRTGQHPPYPPQAGGMARVPSRTHRKSDLINSGQFTRKSRARVTHSRSGSG